MKIWYQSASSYRYDPLFEEYGKILEEQCKRALRPDTEVYVTGVPAFMMEEDRYKIIRYYHVSQVFNNMVKAEEQGYDAFVIGNTLDFGWEEGRGLVDMPVMGISHTSCYLAAMLGELFAIVTTQDYLCEQYRQQVERHGLRDKYLRGNYYFPVTEEELALATANPKPIVDKFKAVAQRAVADGASVIIPAPGLLPPLIYKEGLTHIDGATVVDSISAAVKLAETFADLKKIGIEASRRPGIYGSLDKGLRKEMVEKFSGVLKMEY